MQTTNVDPMIVQGTLFEDMENVIPQLNLNPLRSVEGETLPEGLVKNNSRILMKLGSKVVQIDHMNIQLQIDHLTQCILIGKFIGHKLDNAAQIRWLASLNAKFAPKDAAKLQ